MQARGNHLSAMNHPLSINSSVHDIVQPGVENPARIRADLQAIFESAMVRKHQAHPHKNPHVSNPLQEERRHHALSETEEKKEVLLTQAGEINAQNPPLSASFQAAHAPLNPMHLLQGRSRHPENAITAPPLPIVTEAALAADSTALHRNFPPELIPEISATMAADPASADTLVRAGTSQLEQVEHALFGLIPGSPVFAPDTRAHTDTQVKNEAALSVLTPPQLLPSDSTSPGMPEAQNPPLSAVFQAAHAPLNPMHLLQGRFGHPENAITTPPLPVVTEAPLAADSTAVHRNFPPGLNTPMASVTTVPAAHNRAQQHNPSGRDRATLLSPPELIPGISATMAADPASADTLVRAGTSQLEQVEHALFGLIPGSPVFAPDTRAHTDTQVKNEAALSVLTPPQLLPSDSTSPGMPEAQNPPLSAVFQAAHAPLNPMHLLQGRFGHPENAITTPPLPVVTEAPLAADSTAVHRNFPPGLNTPMASVTTVPAAHNRAQQHNPSGRDRATLLSPPELIPGISATMAADAASADTLVRAGTSQIEQAEHALCDLIPGGNPAFAPDTTAPGDTLAKDEAPLPALTSPQLAGLTEELTVHIHTLITQQGAQVHCQLMTPTLGMMAVNIGIHAGELQIAIQAPPEIQKQLMRSHQELLARLQRRHPAHTVMLNVDHFSGPDEDSNAPYPLHHQGGYQ